MGRVSKKQKLKSEKGKKLNERIAYDKKCLDFWTNNLDWFEKCDLYNPRGRKRSSEENKVVLLSLKMLLSLQIEMAEDGLMNVQSISWSSLERIIAENLHMNHGYVKELRVALFADGDVLEFDYSGNKNSPRKDDNNDDAMEDEEDYDFSECILNKKQVQLIIDEVDYQHSLGETVTRNKIRKWLIDEHNITISKHSVGRYFGRAGLSYKPIRKKKRNLGLYRNDLLRDYIMEFSALVAGLDDPDCNYVLVFTDESYIHQNHSAKMSYVHKDSVINKSSSKGDRLIILHAISHEKPIAELDDNDYPVSDLEWGNTDVPKIRPRLDGKMTAECMWKSSTRTGDYHDNMNSDMFYHWVVHKLVPTFERLYHKDDKKPQMILILDNAAYHHKREVGSLGSMKKSDLQILCKLHGVNHIDIPINEKRMNILSSEDAPDSVHIVGADDGTDYCRIMLYYDDDVHNDVSVFDRATPRTPMIPTVDELKVAIVNYLAIYKPEVLECKVERYLNSKGHRVLWTPPYTPDLQPIELFWAAGKNHVALNSKCGLKMRGVVDLLRTGWYGDPPEPDGAVSNNEFRKNASPCDRLFQHVIKKANETFIPMCEGLSGEIGALVVSESHKSDYSGLPIDMLIADIEAPDDRYPTILGEEDDLGTFSFDLF